MVAEGEDWKTVEIPEAEGVAPAASNAQEEPEESEQSTGGNSTVIYIYSFKVYVNTLFILFFFFSSRN